MRSQLTLHSAKRRCTNTSTGPCAGEASYAGRQARLRLSVCATDRDNILAFRSLSRKHPVLHDHYMARTRDESALANKIIDAVCKLSLGSSTDKLLLLMLANHADTDGKCHPGIALLCQETDLSRRAIFDSLKRLTTAGYIEVIHRHRHSNNFQLNLGALGAPQSAAAAPQSAAAAPQSAAAAPRTLKESSFEPSKNLKSERPLETVAERDQSRKVMQLIRRQPESIAPEPLREQTGNPFSETEQGRLLAAHAAAIGFRPITVHEDPSHYRMVVESAYRDFHGNPAIRSRGN